MGVRIDSQIVEHYLTIGTNFSANTSYALAVGGNTLHNGIVYFANGTTYFINNSAVGYLNDLRVNKTRLADNWLGFYSSGNAGGVRYGYIQTAQDTMVFIKENGTSGTVAQFKFNGHLVPNSHNAYDLGLSGTRWRTLYLQGNLVMQDMGTPGSYPATANKITWTGGTDGAQIYYQVDSADAGRLFLNMTDDANALIALAYNGTAKAYFNPSTPSFYPATTNTGSLGLSANYWSAAYIQTLAVSGATTIGGNLTVGGSATINGADLRANQIYANLGGKNNAGGVSLYSTSAPTDYGIALRSSIAFGWATATDWSYHFYLTGGTTRGWKFYYSGSPVTSIDANGYISARRLNLMRSSGVEYGRLYWYQHSFVTWVDYMSNAVDGGAPTSGKPGTLGNVTSWAKHSLIENASGYGWIWEAAANTTQTTNTVQPTSRMALSSYTGQLRIASNATSTTNETGTLILSSAENGSSSNVALELWRGGNASWQIANESGTFYLRTNYTTAKQTTYSVNTLVVDYNTGAASIPYLAIGQTTRNTSYRLYVNGTSYQSSTATFAGQVKFANNVWNTVGDDAQLGDINKAGHIGIQGLNGNTGLFFTTYNQTTKTTGGAITYDGTRFIVDKSWRLNTNRIEASSGKQWAFIPTISATNANVSTSAATTDYLKGALKYLVATYNYGDMNLFTQLSPNSQGPAFGHIYSTSTVNADTGLPQYSTFYYQKLASDPILFGTNNYTWYQWTVITSNNYTSQINLSNMATGVLPTGRGGTGNSSHTANRIVWASSASKLEASGTHYFNGTSLALNSTAAPSYNLFVNGTSFLGGHVYLTATNGRIVGPHGVYTSTASSRYSNSALEIRENNLVGSAQSAIGYAPTIGWHWGGRIAATTAFHSDGLFYFIRQNGTERATIDANIRGYLEGATFYDDRDVTTERWYKFAVIKMTGNYQDAWIRFIVSSGEEVTRGGILLVRFRTNADYTDINNASLQMYWESIGASVDINCFVFTIDGSGNGQLWCRCPGRWTGWHFIVLDRGTGRNVARSQRDIDVAEANKTLYWHLQPSASNQNNTTYTNLGRVITSSVNASIRASNAQNTNMYLANGTATRMAYYSSATTISPAAITSDGSYLANVSRLTVNTGHQTSYTAYINGTTYHSNHIYIAAGMHIYMQYNSTNYNVLHNHNNGNISLNAAGAGLYMAYQNTTFVNWMNGRMELRNGCLSLFPNAGNYREGIRIHAYSNWSDITLCGADNANNEGSSANSWFLGNNNGNFYITRNGSTGGTSSLCCVGNIWKVYGNQTNSKSKQQSILHIYGPTVGNTATDMVSGTAGVFRWGDGGPQITFDTSATPGGSQAGALIFTDNDSAAAGASFHFVTNQTDDNSGGNLTVTAPRFRARKGLTVGRNDDQTGWQLYVTGVTYSSGRIRSDTAVRGQYVTIQDNWLGVYNDYDAGGNRYGYMQIDRSANGTWRFVKEQGGVFTFNANTTVGTTTAGGFGLGQTNGTGLGISLYGSAKNAGAIEYGLFFALTSTFGTHGKVTSDWATYLTMSGANTRGWIFRHAGANVTSINSQGHILTNGNIYIGSTGVGGYLNGGATNGGINSILLGDDVWLGDCNQSGIMGMKSTGTNCGFYFYNSSGTNIGQLYCRGANEDIYSNKPLLAPSISSSWLDGQRYERGGFNLTDANNTGSYWPWMRQTNTSSAKWFSFGTLNTSFYWIGSATSRTENSSDASMRFDLSTNRLYANFQGPLYGNADTASAWATARNLTVGNKTQSVRGNADVTWALNDILYNATTIGTATSWDQLGPSVYYVASSSAFTGTNHPGSNGEQAPYTWGQLIVSRAGAGGILQVYAPHTGSAGNINSGLRYRTGWNNAGWQTWSTLLDDRIWRKYIFANKNIARSTLTVTDSSWAVTSGTDVFGLSFKDTALTYTPSGGSATASSDTGDWRAWLTCAANSNTVTLNMRIDGTWQALKFIGPLQGDVQGNATSASNLISNNRMDYGWNGINYFNLSAANQSAAKVNDTPSSSAVWWHILRFNHANNNGYYTDLAVPFNANSLFYKRVAGGTLQNSSTNGGWVKVLDQLNYTDYTVTKTGSGASGTWAINISGNAAKDGSGNVITSKYVTIDTEQTISNHKIFYTRTQGATAYASGSAIEIREVNLVTTNQSAWDYAPKIGFHWGGRYQGTIGLNSNGQFYFGLSSSTSNVVVNTGTLQANGHVKAQAGYLYSTLNGNTVQIGSQNGSYCHFSNSADIPFWFNKVVQSQGGFTVYNTGNNHWRNGYLKINNNGGGDCYIEILREANADWRILNTGGNLLFQSDYTSAKTSYFNVFKLDYNTGHVRVMKGRFYVPEWIEFSASACGLYFPNGNGGHFYPNNVSSYGTFVIKGARGGYTGLHLGDTKNYMTIMGGTENNGLYCESKGRWIIYYNTTNDRISLNGANSNNNVNVAINGSCGASGAFISTTNNGFRIIHNSRGTFWHWNGSTPRFYLMFTNANDPYGSYNDARPFYVDASTYYSYFTRAYGAVWNDYAEFRKGATTEPGRVVIEQPNGIMIMCTERLAPGAKVISDTYGFAIGETKEQKTPIAVSGRVLVYPYRDRSEYPLGAAVCAAPNGTVDIMTRDEIMTYPERIIGTVSEIPNYETWACSGSVELGPNDQVQVNGRIWIYVK